MSDARPHDSDDRSRAHNRGRDEESPDDQARNEARAIMRLIRAHTTGTLLCGDRATPLRYVVDNATGALVCPIPGALLDLDDYVLMVPEESFDAMQISVEPVVIDQRADPACDRHLAYHGPQDPSPWVRFQIFSAKANHPTLGALVGDGAMIMTPNALKDVEPRLCKIANSDQARLIATCKRMAGVAIERPLVVGTDPDGLDVRAKFGIVRLEVTPPINDSSSAAARLDELLNKST